MACRSLTIHLRWEERLEKLEKIEAPLAALPEVQAGNFPHHVTTCPEIGEARFVLSSYFSVHWFIDL